MARIRPDQFDNYSDSKRESSWFKLKDDGDIARVQFMYKHPDDIDIFAAHKVKVNGYDRYVDCKRSYDDPIDKCPFCEAGIKVEPVMILSMYDHSDNTIKIWQRGKNFKKQLDALFNRYGNDLTNRVFEIERHGVPRDKDTTYGIFPVDVDPIDISNIDRPDFLGTVILDKTPDEMQIYLDTNSFPDKNNTNTNNETFSRRTTSDSVDSTSRFEGRRRF